MIAVVSFVSAQNKPEEAYTNVVGRVIIERPSSIEGSTVIFPSGKMPLSVFPAREQRRLRVATHSIQLPADLSYRYEMLKELLARQELLESQGVISLEVAQKKAMSLFLTWQKQVNNYPHALEEERAFWCDLLVSRLIIKEER